MSTGEAKDPADDLRLRGNFEFSAGRFDAALSLYSAGLEQAPVGQGRVLLLCNRSATYFQQEQYELAEADAAEAWNTSEKQNVKAAFRLAKTQLALKKFEEAKSTIQAALKLMEQEEKAEEEQKATDVQKKSLEDLWQQVLNAAFEHQKSEGKPETTIRNAQRPISIREFEKGKILGHGNFSEIVVVTHKTTKETFALKMIPKKQAADLAKRQHPNVYNEIQMERRVLLERMKEPHPNIIHMYHAFQDYNTIYYLMDLHTVSRDLWSELQWEVEEDAGLGKTTKKKYMTGCHRSQAVRWMYQMVDALEHMHRHGVVHRDLKTENVLLNERNHVVVIDFGTAKDLIQTDLNGPEFVGTPDFMSPEAVGGTSGMEEAKEAVKKGEIGALHTADLWAVGAMLYIMHTGMTPFWSASQYLAFLKIKRGNLRRSSGIIDDDAWDLIQELMQVEPAERIGADAFKLVFANEEDKSGKRRIEEKPGGYDMIRGHPYFLPIREAEEKDPDEKQAYVIPSLKDMCVRAVAVSAYKDSLDLELCDQHPPGDGSRYDLTRLNARDRDAVLHVLDRRKLLNDPRLYARFFKDPIASRLDKIRPATHEFVGLTQMNDEQGKAPKATMNDPYATPIEQGDIEIVHLTNPLLCKEKNQSCDEETRKRWVKLFKKCIASINRSRPKLVVAAGFIDAKCRKLLSRINETIPVVAHDGSECFAFWMMGVQCIAIKSSETAEDSEQVTWLREVLEQCRMSKHPLYCFTDSDPKDLPIVFLKRLARGRVLALYGLSKNETYSSTVSYTANETIPVNDDIVSLCSVESEEDEERDNFTMKMEAVNETGLRLISVAEEPDVWDEKFTPIEIDVATGS